MIAFTRPRATLAGLLSAIFAAFETSVSRNLPVDPRFSFIVNPVADRELPAVLVELLLRP
jgi:hypothetical protein